MRKKKTWNYETTASEVEAVIEQIESGALPLEELFEKFAIAVEQLRQCESFLQEGKERMDLLIENLEDEPEF